MSMIFTYQYEPNDTKITVEIPKDADIHEVTESIKAFLIASGFHPETVNGAFGDDE